MGIIDFSLNDIGSLATDIRTAITGKEIVSEIDRAEMLYKLKVLEAKALRNQSNVNLQEAKHKSLFVSGWRPSIGWIGSLAIAYSFIIQPFLILILRANGVTIELPTIELGPLMTLITGILGLGAMRTIDKKNGVATL